MAGYGDVWKARFELLRPGNALMAAAGVLVGLVVVEPIGLGLAAWIAAPLAAFLITGFGNILNDVADLDTDRRAHPERPLPSGRIERGDALGFAFLLLGLGLWEAFVAGGLILGVFAALNAALLGLYEWKLKASGLAGNAAVAVLVGSTFVFGATAGRGELPGWGVAWLIAVLAAATNLARELLKDLEDAEADEGRRRTFPMRAGRPATLVLAGLLTLAAVAASAAAVRLADGWWPSWWIVLAAADLVMLGGAGLAWRDAGRGQRLLKAGMAGAVLAFLAGPLAPHLVGP